MTATISPRRLLGLLAVTAAVALTGCSSGAASDSSHAATATTGSARPGSASPAAASDAAAASGPAGGGATTGAHPPVNVCSIMPAAATSTAAGVTFTSANESDDGRGTYTCFYNGAAGLHWDVSVHQDPSRATLDDMLALLGDGQPVQGIGDKAYVSTVGMAVQLGDRLLWVGSGSGSAGSASSYEALAKAVIAALK